MCWLAIIMAIGIASLYIEPPHVLTVAKTAFISLLAPVFQTLYHAKWL